jgi:peptidoglycan/xylan/chitin deacetylase (PgdA/CDA1 family)
VRLLTVVVGSLSFPVAVPIPAAAQRATSHEIALTIDDVPVVRPGARPLCDADSLRQWTSRFVDRIDRLRVPVAAFVVIDQVCPKLHDRALREALLTWRGTGATIGNHTASHPDYHRTPLAIYLQDVDRGGKYLRALFGSDLRYFRPPYLHTGRTRIARDSLAAALKERGYVDAPVTVDNQEWVYAAAYEHMAGDDSTGQRIAAAFLDHIDEALTFSENAAQTIVGRPVSQVLLLHANRLVYDNLPALVSMIRRRGYEWVSLDRALSDPVYLRGNPFAGEQGLSWTLRWATPEQRASLVEPREAPWIRSLLRP